MTETAPSGTAIGHPDRAPREAIRRRVAGAVFAGALAALTAGAAYTSVLVSRQQNAPSETSRYNVTWLISQAGVELARLHASVGGAALAGAAAGADEVQLRLDILANRIRLLEAGDVQEFIRGDPEFEAIVAQLGAVLAQARPLADDLGDAASVRRLYALLSPLNGRLARLASAANIRSGDRVAEVQQQLNHLYRLFQGLLAGMVVCGLGMIASLRRRNADLRRAHARAEAIGADLRRAGERFDAALSNMSQGLCMADADRRVLVCNRRFVEMFGLAPDDARIGARVADLFRAAERGDRFPGALVAGVGAEQERLALRPRPLAFSREGEDGSVLAVSHRPMPDGGWVATYEDATERKRAERQIAYMAHHDALTGLPNRTLLHERIARSVAQLGRGVGFAVLCLDLDRFKAVNDTLGHAAGDALLRAVSERLLSCVRETDTVARLGGDEFAVVQAGTARPEDVEHLAGRILAAVGAPYDLDGHQVVIGTSVGIAVAPGDGGDGEQLLRSADTALYRAKADGRGVYRFFAPEMDARLQARRAVEVGLRRALAVGEFELFYQPLLDLRTDRVSGFEALLRWHHPERGLIAPSDFIPIAEEIGLIVPIGEWVLRRACADAASWPLPVRVAVNVSPTQFGSTRLVDAVAEALAASGLPAGRLELEITESVLLQDNDATLSVLHRFRGMGVRISMDDFGTGYSSLSYLRSFPFDKIKIDRSFVQNLSDGGSTPAIVSAIADLGSSLGMGTTAEGVETHEQLSRLREQGCTEVQGYFISPPRPAPEIPGLLERLDASLKSAA